MKITKGIENKIKYQIKNMKENIKYFQDHNFALESAHEKNSLAYYLKGLSDVGIKQEQTDKILDEVDKEIEQG